MNQISQNTWIFNKTNAQQSLTKARRHCHRSSHPDPFQNSSQKLKKLAQLDSVLSLWNRTLISSKGPPALRLA